MIFYFERRESQYLIFFDQDDKKHEILISDFKLKDYETKDVLIEGNVFISDDFKTFTYSEDITKNRKEEMISVQKKLFGI